MKNALCIDVDTDRSNPISITKPQSIPQPTTPEEAIQMITLDISCLSEAIVSLIQMLSQRGENKDELVNATVKTIYSALTEPNSDKI